MRLVLVLMLQSTLHDCPDASELRLCLLSRSLIGLLDGNQNLENVGRVKTLLDHEHRLLPRLGESVKHPTLLNAVLHGAASLDQVDEHQVIKLLTLAADQPS